MDIWQVALSDLETKVSSHNFESWFRNIRFGRHEGRVAHLEVNDEFFKAWIEENYIAMIENSLSSARGEQVRVVLHVAGEAPSPITLEDSPEPMAARQSILDTQGDIFTPVTPPPVTKEIERPLQSLEAHQQRESARTPRHNLAQRH